MIKMIILPFKVLKKHCIVHLLWFLFVPVISSIGLIFNLMNSNMPQVVEDIGIGYFYIISIALICSSIYDIAVCFYEFVIEKRKDTFMVFKLWSFFVLLVLIIPTILFQTTKIGDLWPIQFVLFVIVCFISFYVRLVFKMDTYLNEDGDYLLKENEDIEKLKKNLRKGNNPSAPDGTNIKV